MDSSEPRIRYRQCLDAEPQMERSALATVFRFVLAARAKNESVDVDTEERSQNGPSHGVIR